MDTPMGGKISERFDARIISLHSRGVQDGIPQSAGDAHFYYSFCYYDAIQISKVNIRTGTILQSAYSQALENGDCHKEFGFQQFLVAVTDVLPETEDDQIPARGYVANQIKTFWDNSKEAPLFFVSMINLKEAADLQDVLTNIQKEFPAGEGHLAYLTFDHCDIILFSYGTNFCDYTKRIFKLYYGCEKILDDVITLYGFAPDRNLLAFSEEKFRALIRVGVRDFPMACAFQKKTEELGHAVQCSWLLGRNDISVLCEDASLIWLADVRQALIDVEANAPESARWYTTYDLMVFSPDQSSEPEGNWISYGKPVDCSDLCNRIMKDFADFQDLYHQAYDTLKSKHNLTLTPDEIWLRWLRDSCKLATSLMGSRLSIDLATCLIPQLQDLFQYAAKFFSSENLKGRNEIDKIHESFRIFFSNAAILVDSMNQTNRQFVQVPAFHLPSFNIPPQILAYYTVLVQRIREILQDDEETIYSLAISPELINILSVSSLAVQDVLPDHQWISISMDETSFYSLKTTTETLAHEISHFIGEENRNRVRRKECILRCAFQLIFVDILQRLYDLINQKYNLRGPEYVLKCPTFEFLELEEISDKLQMEAIRICGAPYGTSQDLFSKDLANILKGIPGDILYMPQFADSIFNEVCALIERHPAKFDEMINMLRDAFCRLNRSEKENLLENDHFNKIITERLRGLFQHAIADLSSDFDAAEDLSESDVDICYMVGSLCYTFRETFADLQAILLLDMKWTDYCQLMQRSSKSCCEGILISDTPLRMLAVSIALVGNGKWSPALVDCGELFTDIRECVGLRIEARPQKLRKKGFNPSVLYYLVEYLLACEKEIEDKIDSTVNCKVKKLQEMYAKLSDETAFIDLQETLLTFIEAYQESLLSGNSSVNADSKLT